MFMKKIFLLLAMLVLLQSCFSYKAMDNDPSKMEAGKTYKIYHNHKFTKVVFKSITDSSAIVLKGRKERKIPLNEIAVIEKRKFSVVKTVALALPLILVISYIADPEINVGVGGSSPN
jgi:hypothetical protein